MAHLPYNCPHCNAALGHLSLSVGAAEGTITYSPGVESITHDGDIIPGLPESVAGVSALHFANVGTCNMCSGSYWFFETELNSAGEAALIEAISLDRDLVQVSSPFEVDGLAVVIFEYGGSGAINHTVSIGPMKVNRDLVTYGAAGVSACGGGEFWAMAAQYGRSALPVFSEHYAAIR